MKGKKIFWFRERFFKALPLVGLLILLIASPGFSEVKNLDLSKAMGSSYSVYNSSLGRWELTRGPWQQIKEGLSDLEQGSFDGTVLNSEDKIVISTPAHCSGTFISKVHDLSQVTGDEIMTYNLYIPNTTGAIVYLRHGQTPTPMSEWSVVPSSDIELRSLIGDSKYIQYKVFMESNSQCQTSPSFEGVSFLWTKFNSGPGRVKTPQISQIRAPLVKSVSVAQSSPSGTELRWAVSDDDGNSYKKYQNGSWVKITDISSNGNTKDELQGIPPSAWKSLNLGYFRLFFSLKTSLDYLTPSVSAIQVDYDLPEVTISSLSCPSSLYVEQKGNCLVVSQANIGTLDYRWSGSSDIQVIPNGASAEISFKALGRKTLQLKAFVKEIEDIFTVKTATIDVTSPPKPRIKLSGPKGVMFGESATYRAEVTCPEGLICSFRFLVDNIVYQTETIEVLFGELGKHNVVAQAWDPQIPGSLGENTISVYVSEVSKPYISIKAPKKVELGVPFTLMAQISARYGTPSGYWILPDGSHVDGDTLTYTAMEKRDDLKFKYAAYIEGFDYTTTTVESSSIKVDVYEMSQFKIKSYQKLDKPIYAPYGAFFGVTGNVGIAKDFGVSLTHQWDFGDGTIIEGEEPKRAGHFYAEAGTYSITLRVLDDRGNISTDSLEVNILSAPPVVVESFKIIASNKFNRAPLKVFLKPKVTGGHPSLDKVSSYLWAVNGEPVSESRMFSATFNEPGDYVIGLRAETKTGKVAEGTQTITVNPNQLPQCAISYQDYPKYKYTKITPSCKDPDGKIKSYSWDLGNGMTFDNSKVFAKYQESGTYIVSLTVTDDSGGQAVFSLPVTVER